MEVSNPLLLLSVSAPIHAMPYAQCSHPHSSREVQVEMLKLATHNAVTTAY